MPRHTPTAEETAAATALRATVADLTELAKGRPTADELRAAVAAVDAAAETAAAELNAAVAARPEPEGPTEADEESVANTLAQTTTALPAD